MLTAIESARRAGAWVALAAAYELGYALEPALRPLLRPEHAPLLTAWVLTRARRCSAAETERRLAAMLDGLGPDGREAGLFDLHEDIGGEDYRAGVERIRAYIEAGDCYQVNFTFRLLGETWGDPLALYARLRAAQPVRYGAFVRHPQGTILSRSPELFFERRGARLTCKPMKGTAPRETDPQRLQASPKDRAENLMIVDLIRNDLGRLVRPGGVRVERLFEAEPYSTLWQLTSTISAAPVEADLEAVLRALFPCGSITGAPKIRAMQIIDELESTPRGLYCGALGWLAPDGDCRFNVPIRTIEIDRGRRARMGIGSGIVYDSDPTREWDECRLKARFLRGLQPGLRLIETLRREPDETYPRLAGHLERLRDSARHFGFAFDEEAVRAALRSVTGPAGAPWRVRLTLGAAGDLEVSTAPLPPLGASAPTLVLSPQRLDSGDPLLRHKTSLRRLYEAELARVGAAGHFDALFLNERDELCEGARSNLFLRIDGELLTPPLSAGLLNGVLRRSLIGAGQAREATLRREDLARAQAILLGNALRGLFEVRLVVDGEAPDEELAAF